MSLFLFTQQANTAQQARNVQNAGSMLQRCIFSQLYIYDFVKLIHGRE